MDNEFVNDYKKQNKRNSIMLIILIISIILFMGLLIVKIFIKKFDSRFVFVDFFTDVFDKLDDSFISYEDDFKGKNIQLEYDVNLSSSSFDEIGLNSVGVNLISQFDFFEHNLFADVSYLEDENKILNMQLSYDDDYNYVFLNNIFDKVLKINYEEGNSLEETMDVIFNDLNKDDTINEDDIRKFINMSGEIISKNIKDDNFIKSKETVIIEEKEFSLDKHSYVLEDNDYSELIISIVTDIKNNSEYVDLLVKILDVEKDKLISNLDDIILEYTDKSINMRYEFIIYTKGLFSENVGIGISALNKDEENLTKIKYFNIDGYYKILLEDEFETFAEEDIYYVIEGKEIDDIIKLTFKENGEILANITYKAVGDSMELVIGDPLSEYAIKLYYSSLKEDGVVSNNFSISYADDLFDFKVDVTTSISAIEQILKLNNDNIMNLDDLTEEDALEIKDNFMKVMEESKLFNGLFGSYYSELDNTSSM